MELTDSLREGFFDFSENKKQYALNASKASNRSDLLII